MQIKRFEAKTMTAALKLVKEEFGPDAVILSARSQRRDRNLFGTRRVVGVEVTAATDDGWMAYTPTGRPTSLQSGREASLSQIPGRNSLFHTLHHRLRSLTNRRPPQTPDGGGRGGVPDLTELHQQFLTQEVQRDLAADLIDRIRRLPGYDPLLDTERLRIHAGAILQEMGLALPVDAGAHLSSRVVVLVGPSGVGKTTTAIKLAALQAVRPGRKVALMTLDDRRIGALDQLRIYSRLLEVPLAVATSPEDARQALNDFQALDGIIVDTPGISRGEENRLLELRRILEPLTSKEVHLVLNASTRERDLVRIIDAWKDLGVNRLAFTRLDEASTWGGLLNLLLRTRLPLSYLSTGPRIPDDLAEAPLELLIHRLWPAHAAPIERRDPVQPGLDAAESLSRKISAPFVANRNSDLYHRPECKWALKIKHGNLIQFASAQAAEARRFAPCRSCCPYEADGEAGRREGHRISSYR